MGYIKIWEHWGRGVRCFPKANCFASLSTGDRVRYISPLSQELTNEMVDCYVRFLKDVFADNKFSHRLLIVKNPKVQRLRSEYYTTAGPGRYVVFDFNRGTLPYRKALVYLTAFRYVQEFPDYVELVWNNRQLPIGELFILFQKKHVDDKCYSHHALMNGYRNFVPPISVIKFHANLSDENITTVWGHFI